MKHLPLLLLVLLTTLPLQIQATEAPTAELGRQLFESKQLGSNGKSCSTCHTGGKGLEELASYDDPTLKEMINFCIRDALKGSMLDLQSQELEALLAYLRSFSSK